jgi:EAL domain-containing protein (putative c-di-GMP-specific phosphodiesterase class I)
MTASKPSDPEQSRYSLTIEQFLEGGLLVPLFQPIVALGNEAVYGYEGTIRGPVGSSMQSPLQLLATAAAAGLREQLELACCRCQIEEFLRLGLPGKLFLNLSSGALLRASRHEREMLESTLFGSGIHPSQLIVELTENIADSDLNALSSVISESRQMGIGFALDDFGTAQSNLRMWLELRPEIVKIDRYFVNGMHADKQRLETVKLILSYAETFGTLAIAEGIEQQADLDMLKSLGLQFGHGYLLGRPSATPPRPQNVFVPPARRAAEAV